jgi:signal transduction histidine kinase
MVAYILGGLLSATLGPDRTPAGRRRTALAWPVAAAALAVYVGADLGGIRFEAAPPLVCLGLAAAAAAPVALLHGSPLLAWRIAVLGALVTVPAEIAPDGLAWPWHPLQPLILAGTVFAVALRHRGVVAGWVAVLSAAAALARVAERDALTVAALIVIAALTGTQVRRRVRARLVFEQTRQALLEQRTRLARELHDVAGHHMSLIAVRAESAPYRLHRQPAAQEAEFAAIAHASRDALQDMRRLVGVLRAEEPGRTIADVRALVATVAAAGLAVDLDLDPATEHAGADPEAGLAVYRIVQEGLSNVTRHGAGGTARVALWLDGEDVRVRITNANVGGGRSGHGHGIRGMRERAAALGGTLTAGPDGDGGYRLDAVVPRRAS